MFHFNIGWMWLPPVWLVGGLLLCSGLQPPFSSSSSSSSSTSSSSSFFRCPTSQTPGWHPLGFVHSFSSEEPTRVEFHRSPKGEGVKALVVWKVGEGEYFARPDVCAHLGAKLSKGKVLSNGCLQCPYHGVQFGLGAPHREASVPLGVVREGNGLVWWNRNPEEKDNDPQCPELSALQQSDLVVTQWEMEVKASFSDCFRNSMDLHHAGFVHASSFGNKARDPDETQIRWLDKRTLRADFVYYSNTQYQQVTGEKTTNCHLFQQPSTTWNKVVNEKGDKFVFIHVAMRATSPTTTKWYLTGSSNYLPQILPHELKKHMMESITKRVAMMEDKPQLEAMETEDIKEEYAYQIVLPLDSIYTQWAQGQPDERQPE